MDRRWLAAADAKNVAEVARVVHAQPVEVQDQILADVESEICAAGCRSGVGERVALVKILLACIPNSWPTISRLVLETEANRNSAEVRFTLFCFLDEVPGLAGGVPLRGDILALVAKFLRRVRSNTARAAWMAGDLLGDHWDPVESVPILIELLSTGKYVAGRIAALHGLEHAIGRIRGKEAEILHIDMALKETAKSDRSERVRKCARRMHTRRSGCV